ncbi:hypothetical protein BU15DRAFT_36660, partial [Melanogaster broomeanus]
DSFDAFVRGRAGQNHICIDLERDHVPLDPTDIKVSVDIDSLIWVTPRLYFRKAMSIFLGPIIDKAAPIKKHNHVYVEVVVPQSEEDASALSGRTEWWSLPLPLSAIPHTSFGTIGCGSGSLNVYIFFPRMIHRDELSGRRATNIPKEVLDYFWMHVLLPAIADNVDDTEALYAALTLPEVRYKARKSSTRQRKPGRPKAIPFSPSVLQDIVETMKNIIQEEPEKLTLFGSFFFVVEAKGIKLWTKSSADEKKPIQSLISEFPALDWNYMTDRRHGELIIDLGITFHPVWKEPLVGLWRLEQLEASFGASGFVRGNIHHACTLGRYGGIQAEMSQERTRQTHICFRSAYNLAYEAIRPNDNSPTFVLDSDAYACNPQYMQECNFAIEMYEGKAKERSYGVRDEYRLSGFAAIEVLDNLEALTQRYLKSQPMLWMSSATWFDFLARRFRELQRTQICLRRIEPSNMGLLTGILCNMIRSISSTPIILDFHVRESMALLRFSQVCERFGMFFLFDLDLESTPNLPDIQEWDDAEVMRLVGGNSNDRRTASKPIWPVLPSLDDQETFPIGERPTWQAVIKAISDAPWTLMRAWRWDSRLIHLQPVVGKLFTDFTCQMWLFLNKHWLADSSNVPGPACLEEAMTCWTVETVYRSVTACAFEACNANLPGALPRGRPQTPFSGRVAIFFPLPEDPYHVRSPWKVFRIKPGYLWQFHELMQDRDEEERFHILDRLGEIFSNLQCLPTSMATSKKVVGKPWVISKHGKVQFITNPVFYKILGLAEIGAAIQRRAGPRAV